MIYCNKRYFVIYNNKQMKNICCLPCISRLVPGKVSFVTLKGLNRKGGCFGKLVLTHACYIARVSFHKRFFSHISMSNSSLLWTCFSMQNNIYRDTSTTAARDSQITQRSTEEDERITANQQVKVKFRMIQCCPLYYAVN